MSDSVNFDWVDSTILSEIDTTFSTTFSTEEKSNLEITRLKKCNEEFSLPESLVSKTHLTLDDLRKFSICPDQCQIFYIRQKNSYSRLNISRTLFEQLVSEYSVFSRFWDFLLPFSFKTRESDLSNAPFRFRNLGSWRPPKLGSFECSYGFRYVELNNRISFLKENPDYDPCGRKKRSLNAFDLHRILISTLHENWRMYVRSLESLMTQQSERVTLAMVQSETEKLSPLTDFAVNFVDRQRLKMIEDKVLDLVIVFESLHNTLSKLRKQCELHCLGSACENCTCYITMEELEEQMHEAQVNLKKADVLHKRAQGTAQLLSDLLDYENAQIAHLNEKALNGLVTETKDENSKMRVLTRTLKEVKQVQGILHQYHTFRPSTNSQKALVDPDSPTLSQSPLWNSLRREGRPPEIMATTLGEKLEDARCEWVEGSNQWFVPISDINDLVTEENVAEALVDIYDGLTVAQVNSYSSLVCSTSKKLFTLLFCSSKRKYIRNFLDDGISDVDLPFVRCPRERGVGPQRSNRGFDLCIAAHKNCDKASHRDCGINAMASWSKKDITDLCRDQWIVLAPIFDEIPNGDVPHHVLDSNTVMPFIEDQQGVRDKSGGYSHVWGVRIHPAHQKVYKSTVSKLEAPLLAVKQPFSRDVEDFKKETEMLSALAVRQHPHLVKLLVTYVYKSQYHLVFPYANTNLRGYWDDTEVPNRNKETYLWFLKQIQGLTSGLNAIHNFKAKTPSSGRQSVHDTAKKRVGDFLTVEEEKYGRHGDIKPENILWSNELDGSGKEGILQIADMGLGRFHRLESRSAVDPRTVNGSPTYSPPELELQKPVSRAYDMWSLGCVFLEFATWLIEGSSQIYTFADKRGLTGADGINDDTFYTITTKENGQKTAEVRQEVLEWITRLLKNPRCSPMVQDILKLVRERLLVVSTTLRIKSQKLDEELTRIGSKKNNLDYLLGKERPSDEDSGGVKLPKGPKTLYAQNTTEPNVEDAEYSPRSPPNASRTTQFQLQVSEFDTTGNGSKVYDYGWIKSSEKRRYVYAKYVTFKILVKPSRGYRAEGLSVSLQQNRNEGRSVL
ncbi:hypothetical protein G7Y89_g2100 [Cudoniella acicularis]|uniref:Protein kinase domain-containing protein n=1 Tax=Cudoniella acicularis TaxID=354080 RepID=A0A8H4RTY4_9HELO|nr:hypothetical protein G7Y89_g2100 [Cudoniella acicularis]